MDSDIYRSLIRNSPDLFYRTDLEGNITYVSDSVCKLSGYTRKEAVGLNLPREIYLHPHDRKGFLRQLKREGTLTGFEVQLKRKDGSIWWASITSRFFSGENGEIGGIEGMARDITDVKNATQALIEMEERFRLTFHTSPDAINLNRMADGMYMDINQGFTDLTGYTRNDVIGKSSLAINIWKHPADRKRLVGTLVRDGAVRNFEAEFVRKDKTSTVALMSATILTINSEKVILSVTRDISDLKRTQDLMVQSEKMKTVGGLSAGMAHEINSPMAGIVQTADLLASRLTSSENPANLEAARAAGTTMDTIDRYMEERGVPQLIRSIHDSGTRVTTIIENMLSFSRNSGVDFSSRNLADIVDRTLDLAATDYDLKKHYDFKRIEIQKAYDPDVPMISCEKNKIQQVILNILNNGAHAMFEQRKRPPVFFIGISHERDSGMVRMEIRDNGPGMDIETRKKVFEPFFTTKPEGQGTGLGLFISYFIVTKNHGGSMEMDTLPGRGTSFIVRLPIERRR